MDPEVVVMVGIQGSGKSAWVTAHLAATHAVVSKDNWPHARDLEALQRRLVSHLLAADRSVVVDNTSPSPADRAALVSIGHARGSRVRAVFLDTPFHLCLARNAARTGRARVPLAAMLATRSRLVPPTDAEGFDQVDVIRT
jgi:predicted kinase